MSTLLIVEPLAFTALSSRGSGVANLATNDPKEVWADEATGSATLTIDLGGLRAIDTVFLGYASPPAAAATWSISGGRLGPNEQVLQASTALRVPDAVGTYAERSHALWNGAAVSVRYLSITVTQPVGNPALTIGVFIAGLAVTSERGHEWGSGRQLIDTGSVTALPSGGFAVVEGARKRSLTWTFGDLSTAEVDQLEAIALRRGESSTALVIEDATRSAGLWSRCHYGLFKWRAFERRNKVQTRWEMEVVEWV
jgi:hypothetical protein